MLFSSFSTSSSSPQQKSKPQLDNQTSVRLSIEIEVSIFSSFSPAFPPPRWGRVLFFFVNFNPRVGISYPAHTTDLPLPLRWQVHVRHVPTMRAGDGNL